MINAYGEQELTWCNINRQSVNKKTPLFGPKD